MDPCVHMAEFLCSAPETITTLLIGYIKYKIKSKKKRFKKVTMLYLCSVVCHVHLSKTGSVNWASLVDQMVKNLPAWQEARVQSLDQEDPLEQGMATH